MAINLNGTTGITTTGLTSNGIDDNATSTAMTLDTSGNLLVGKTVANTTTLGNTVYAGIVSATMSGDPAIFANRAQDGSVIEIQKNGTTVGSIGADTSRLVVHGTSTGIRFAGSELMPTNGSGTTVDNTVDIGHTTYRFKDLYLSGGVYLGGTGSANKLDDYEVGTWTPTVTLGSITYANAWYIKIGNLVTLGANVWNFSERSSSSGVEINVPFTSVTGPSAIGSMIGAYITSTTGYSSYIGGNQSKVSFYEAPSNTLYEIMKYNDLSSSTDFHFTIAYYTS